MATRVRGLAFEDLTDHDRVLLRAAVHESGHAVASTVLGGRVHAAVIGRGKMLGGTGHTLYDDLPDSAAPGTFYAGSWCEARWLAGRSPSMRDMVSVLARNSSDAKQLALTAGGSLRGRAAVPVLERCWPSVITLAQKLLRDGEAIHEDVCAALQIPPDDNCHHLALIRSGSAPGSFTVTRAAL